MNETTAISTVLLIATILAGCNSPVKIEEAERAVPSAEYIEPEFTESSATLIVVRDSGFSGAALDFVIYVDGKRVGMLRPSQKFEIRVSEGRHIIGLSCSTCRESFRRERDVIVSRGGRYPFRAFLLNGLEIQASSQLE